MNSNYIYQDLRDNEINLSKYKILEIHKDEIYFDTHTDKYNQSR